jgi:hypothetical protein
MIGKSFFFLFCRLFSVVVIIVVNINHRVLHASMFFDYFDQWSSLLSNSLMLCLFITSVLLSLLSLSHFRVVFERKLEEATWEECCCLGTNGIVNSRQRCFVSAQSTSKLFPMCQMPSIQQSTLSPNNNRQTQTITCCYFILKKQTSSSVCRQKAFPRSGTSQQFQLVAFVGVLAASWKHLPIKLCTKELRGRREREKPTTPPPQ